MNTVFVLAFALTALVGGAPAVIPVQEASAWERVGGNLLDGFFNMYQPCVIEMPDGDYPYKMYFFGWAVDTGNTAFPGCDAIFHARSKDLAHWEVWAGDGAWDGEMQHERWRPVVTASDRVYDSHHNGDPSVVYKDGVYYMAYSASSEPTYRKTPGQGEAQMLCCIMGATSTDGIHWRKTGQPLLIEDEETQKADDVRDRYANFLRPSLHWEEGRWRMWFDYSHPDLGVSMGCAENTGEFGAPNGFKVVHDLASPLIPFWVNPDVVRAGNRYYAFGDPGGYAPALSDPHAGWRSRCICEAVSNNGLEWEIVGFVPPDADAAACHVPQALVTEQDGKTWLYVFYSTQRGGTETFGSYDFRYDRLRAMRRAIEPER